MKFKYNMEHFTQASKTKLNLEGKSLSLQSIA